MNRSVNKPLWLWIAVGALAYLALPWYAIQDANGLRLIPQVFSQEQAGNGLLQAARYGRPWLWLGLLGLLVAGVGALLPAGRRQGVVLMAGGGLGLLALLASGFAIGARGWSFEALTAAFGELGARLGYRVRLTPAREDAGAMDVLFERADAGSPLRPWRRAARVHDEPRSATQPLGVAAGITPFNFPVMVPLWMFPVALAQSDAAEWRNSMGFIIIGGLTTSTFLTLLVVPAAYSTTADLKGAVARFGRLARGLLGGLGSSRSSSSPIE